MLRRWKEKFIGDKAFYRMVMSVAFPIMVQNAMTNFVSLLDNIMVGRLGTEQLSGVAIVNQLMFVFYLLLFGGLSGVGIYTAQFFGNHDDEGVRTTFRYKLWLGFLIVIAAGFVLMYFGDTLIGLYLNGSSDGGDLTAALRYGRTYLGVVLFMMPAVWISNLFTSTLRECGETVVPMISGVTAVLTNLVLDYLLIFGKLGLPRMGVAGAALATVISRYIEMLVVVIWSARHTSTHTYFKGIFRKVTVPLALVKKYFVTGMPILINEGLWSIGIAMLGQAYSVRGLNVVAGQNMATTINNMFNIAFIAMGDAVAIIIGQSLGAGDMKKAKDADNKIIAAAVMSSVVIGSIMFAASGLFPRLFKISPAAKMIGKHFIMVQALFMPKDAFLHTTYFTIRAGGKTMITFLFDSVFMIAVSVPVAYILSRFTILGPAWIFALVHAADFLKCIVGFILVRKNVWMKNIVKA